MEEHLAPPPFTVAGGATWAAVFGGPLTWFASQQLSYALVPWACHGGSLLAIHLTNLGALVVIALAGARAWRDWRSPGRRVGEGPARAEGRQRFLGLIGLTLCGLFGLVIVAQALGAFFFGPCQA
jgi:hypothetical protein